MQTATSKKSFKDILDAITKFAKLERLIAGVCIFIPLILFLFDQKCADCTPFRPSISAYVSMGRSYVFGTMLTMAAMLFIFNSVYYVLGKYDGHGERKGGKWYNAILGVALLGVIFFPHNELQVLHYIFAVIFFAGSVIVIWFFCEPNFRKTCRWIAAFCVIPFALLVLKKFIPWLDWMTVFYAEWIALIAIGIHYILESHNNAEALEQAIETVS